MKLPAKISILIAKFFNCGVAGMTMSKELRDYIDKRVEEKSRIEAGKLLEEYLEKFYSPELKFYVFPGGKKPVRSSAGAVGYDFFLRAVVDPHQMDPQNPVLRRPIFDFINFPQNNPETDEHIISYPGSNGNEWAYRLDPGASVLVGVGCVIEMPFPMFHWVAPRSGLASKWKITVTNAPGTVDPDYRGEAGVLILNINKKPIPLTKDMKIAQGIFQMAIIPRLIQVNSYDELSSTERGVNGFGSTGIR